MRQRELFGHSLGELTVTIGDLRTYCVLALLLVLTSCLGQKKPTTKADCGEGNRFDEVTRECIITRSTPTGMLQNLTLFENSGKNVINLKYDDNLGISANRCEVVQSLSGGVEVNSPRLYEMTPAAKQLLDQATTLANNINPIIYPAQSAVALTGVSDAEVAYRDIVYAVNLDESIDGRNRLLEHTGLIADQATATFNSNLVLQAEILDNSRDTFFTRHGQIEQRCHCASNGTCRAVVVPRPDFRGDSTFTYQVFNNLEGVSPARQVRARVLGVNQPPVPVHTSAEVFESPTSVGQPINLDPVPLSRDPNPSDEAMASVFEYVLVTPPAFGTLSGCLGINGQPGLNCVYTPFDGDYSDTQFDGAFNPTVVTGQRATVDFQGVRIEALSIGESGNTIQVELIPYEGLGHPSVGSVRLNSTSSGPVFRVVIAEGQTTVNDVIDYLNDPMAPSSSFVVASLVDIGFDQQLVVLSQAGLAGGQEAQDIFTYEVYDFDSKSRYEAAYSIRIREVDDPPQINLGTTTPLTTPREDTPFVMQIGYTDVDSPLAATACQVQPSSLIGGPFDPVNVAPTCNCVAGVCSTELQGFPDYFGSNFHIDVRVRNGDFQGLNQVWSSWERKTFAIEPVNDAPAMIPVPYPNIGNPNVPHIMLEDGTLELPGYKVHEGDAGAGRPYLEHDQDLFVSLSVDPAFSDLFPASNDHMRLIYTRPNGQEVVLPLDGSTAIPEARAFDGELKIWLRPAQDRFTTGPDARFTLTLRDSGPSNGVNENERTYTFFVRVLPVNDPPTISPIPNVQINEGGIAITQPIYIDEGGGPDEDTQTINLTITSDNETIFPATNIRVFYDTNDNLSPDPSEEVILTGGQYPLNAGAFSSDQHAVFIRLRPVDGISGTANITVTATDNGSPAESTSRTFAAIVHPIGAVHGGWNHISAVGQKSFRPGKPNPFMKCNFNTNKCNDGGSCTGSVAPNSVVSADEANAIFFDSANNKCYWASSAGVSNWQEINTFCPISNSDDVPTCPGASCIGNQNPIVQGQTPTPNAQGQEVPRYYYRVNQNTCYRSTGLESSSWEEYFPAEVVISWKDFILSGSGADVGALISGWNVYRRKTGEAYNFQRPLNASPLGPTVRTFTDTTANASTVYYYVVQPLDNKRNIPTATQEVYSEVRVFSPPTNRAFVHRWMVNQEVCTKLHQGTFIQRENNFRCPYRGPGQVEDIDSGDFFYDIGRDMLVDVAEAGCPYSTSYNANPNAVFDNCGPNGCIGISAPPGSPTTAGLVYYNRGNGTCYRSQGGSWVDVNSIANPNQVFASNTLGMLLPPLVNLTQTRAFGICDRRLPLTASSIDGIRSDLSSRLPTRKEQIAYSAHPLNISATNIDQLERGFSLNTSSKCNSSGANGLEFGYTNAQIPSTSFSFSLPGTDASNIRSMHTGSVPTGQSMSTQACVSRYKIQDPYGNVAEWVSDRFRCENNICVGVSSDRFPGSQLDPTNDDMFVGDSIFDNYAMDGDIGPCRDVNADGVCDEEDRPLTQWRFQDRTFDASYFSFPLGLPIHRLFPINFPPNLNAVTRTLLEIGPTSGITNANLHNDGAIINGEAIELSSGNIGAMATGGGYKNADLAGRYSFELVPNQSISAQVASGGVVEGFSGEIQFEARFAGTAGNDITVRLVDGASSGNEFVTVSGMSVNVFIESGASLGSDIVDAIENYAPSNNLIVITNVINPGSIYFATEDGGRLSGGIDAVENRRPDIGLRCVTPIAPTAYDYDPNHQYPGYPNNP